MEKFDNFKILCEDNDIIYTYAENELSNFLGCNGSDIVTSSITEPTCMFELETKTGEKVSIGVTSLEVREEEFKNYFWIEK